MRSEELYDLLIKSLRLFPGDHGQITVDLVRPTNYSVTMQGSPIDSKELVSLSQFSKTEIKNYFYRVLTRIPSDFNDSVQCRIKYFNYLFNDSSQYNSSLKPIIDFIYKFFHQGGLLHLVSAAFLQATFSFFAGKYASSSRSETFFQYDDQLKRLIISQYACVSLTNIETDKVCSNVLSLLLVIPVSEIPVPEIKESNKDDFISLPRSWVVDLTIHSLDSEIMKALKLEKSFYTRFQSVFIKNLSNEGKEHLQQSLLHYARAQRRVRILENPNFIPFLVKIIEGVWKSKSLFLNPFSVSLKKKKKCVELLFNVTLTDDGLLDDLFLDFSSESIELYLIIREKQERTWTQTAFLNALHICRKLEEFGLWNKNNAHELLGTIKTFSGVKIQLLQESLQKRIDDEKLTDFSLHKGTTIRTSLIRTSLLTGFFHCPDVEKTDELEDELKGKDILDLVNKLGQSNDTQLYLQRSGNVHRA